VRFPRVLGGTITEAAAALEAGRPELTAAAALAPHQVGPASPFNEPNHLQAIVWADLTDQTATMLTRAGAMSIPALARQRHLMAGVAAKCPLVLLDTAGTAATEQPSWLTAGTGILSAYHRMLWTVDDLLFHPFSVWRWTDADIPERIPTERWEVDEVDRLKIDGEYAREEDVIVIPGPHEGILNFGAAALRRVIDNLDSAARAARNPSAYLELHYTGSEPITDAQKTELLADWAKARRGENGGVAYTGPNLEVKEHGTHEAHLLIEGRNADAVDVSRMVSSPAAMADATSAGASLTYETGETRNTQFLDYGASLYMDSIAARLSMDDVSPPGFRVGFDVTGITSLSAPTNAAPAPQE
jgi:hypothetical protein